MDDSQNWHWDWCTSKVSRSVLRSKDNEVIHRDDEANRIPHCYSRGTYAYFAGDDAFGYTDRPEFQEALDKVHCVGLQHHLTQGVSNTFINNYQKT